MSDRLPSPVEDGAGEAPLFERASATSARAVPSRTPLYAVPGGAPAWTSLRELEEGMVEAITGSEAAAAVAASRITAGPSLSARDRLEIYRFGYRARLVECLDDDYPILARTLGQGAFERLADQYIDRFPSRSPSLNAFGRRMAELCRDADLGEHDGLRPFLGELASLEWALVEIIHAKEPPPFDLAALKAIPVERWSTARLLRSDAVRVLHFEYPVNAFYQACRTRDELPRIPSPSPSATAVYRRSWKLWRMDLTPAMTRVLDALLAGMTIAESLGRIGVDESDPDALAEAERSVMVWFSEWMQGGFFAGVELAD
ncbi:MAG TPA: DNA-binding domain-containing protein [Polyangiaceae bacterium]|nr:DNA-binding domain-containing protein [Polyangiaceae bacterium]